MTTINADSLSVDLANELGEILETELVHVIVAEVDHSVRIGRVKHLSWQDRMAQELSQNLGR